jgi:hypothetical protein
MSAVQSPTNPHWARVVGYGPFSLCVLHKEGLCPSSGSDDDVCSGFVTEIMSISVQKMFIYLKTIYVFNESSIFTNLFYFILVARPGFARVQC